LQYGRPEYLLIAGGIGITPMVGMAQALQRHGRPFRLLYAGRTRDQMPFVDDLRKLVGERLELFVSADGTRLDVGREIDRLDPEGEAYLCGPLRLRDAVQQAWQAQDRPAGRLQFETFASGGRFAPEEFVVRLADQHDHEVRVGRNRTLLGALQDDGVDMMWDCLRGECGLCAVRVVDTDAQIDHRDVFLSPEQHDGNEAIVTCVSRAVGGSLVIDTGFRQPSG
jgi:ferredoxin